jgi:dTDP-4-amino-4,6-dideoxygalactose transaminase
MKPPVPFEQPVHISRPLLPDIDALSAKLREIWNSQWLTNGGAAHDTLEKRLCEILRARHLSLFNNGTIALIVACQSLRLSGEVITTPFTFPATAHVLSWNGIRPIFCDIDPVTLNIDPTQIEQNITAQTTGILGVHVYGTPCDVQAIQSVADRYGLRVVYDAAHAFGGEIRGRGIGTFGDVSMFSFHATKLFHTAEGGALTFNDPNLKARTDLLKNFGIKDQQTVMMPGINGKMNEIQAALGLLVLDLVDEERNRRHGMAAAYRERLRHMDGISFLEEIADVRRSQQYFVIRIDAERFGASRDRVHDEFRKFNVMVRKYFYPLCSEYACYRQLPSSHASKLPNAHRAAAEVLALPFYGRLGMEGLHRVCDMLESCRGIGI